MVKVPPFRSSRVSVPLPAPGGEVADAALDLGERHPVGVAEHGHDQPAFGADGDADVVVALAGRSRRPGSRRSAAGNALSAPTAALTKNERCPARRRAASGTPPCGARAAPSRRVMSTSLKVVSIAAVRCASTSRRAMVAPRLVIRTRSSARAPAARPTTGGGDGAAGLAAAGGGAGGAAPGAAVPATKSPDVLLGDAAAADSGHCLELDVVLAGHVAGRRRRLRPGGRRRWRRRRRGRRGRPGRRWRSHRRRGGGLRRARAGPAPRRPSRRRRPAA